MLRSILVVLVALALACSTAACGNAGLPAFEHTRPKPLAPVGPARDSRTVRIAMKSLPWWTVAGTSEGFILGFDDNDALPCGHCIAGRHQHLDDASRHGSGHGNGPL